MVWVSAGSEVIFETPGGTERVLGYLDRDIQAPDPVNTIVATRTFGAGNKYQNVQQGMSNLNGSMSLVPTTSEIFYYLMANSSDTNSYPTPTDNMDGTYTHTVRPSITPGTAPFILKLVLDQGTVTQTFRRSFTGCQFYSGAISCAVEQPLRVDLQYGATGITTDQTTQAATAATAEPFAFYMLQSDVTLMGESITKLESFEMSWDNASRPKHYFNDDDSRYPSEIVKGYGDLTFSGTLTVDRFAGGTSNSVYHFLDGRTPLDITIPFERGTNDTVTFTLDNCLMESAPHSLPDTGDEIRVPVTIMPETWTITSRNTTATFAVA